MATEIHTTVNAYHRLPIADVPSNQPYQTREGSKEDSADRALKKEEFLKVGSELRWPDIELTRLNAQELAGYRSMLLGLLDDIDDAPEETSVESQDAAYDALIQKIEEINRHLVVARRLGNRSAAEWLGDKPEEELRKLAAEQNLEIFGRPEVKRFNWFLAKDREVATSKLEDSNDVVRQKAQEFLDRTGDVVADEQHAPLEMSPEAIETLRGDLFEIFPGLKEYCGQDFPDKVSVMESLPYFNQARDIMGLPASRYDAYLSNRRAAEETPKGVAVGMQRKTPFNAKSLTRLPFHEWLHVLRRHNARKQLKPENRLATRANLAFEEALCVLMERTLIKESYTSGVKYYKAIGLQMGLDRTQDNRNLDHMRDARETIEIMALAEGLSSGADTEEAFEACKEKVYDAVMRTTRGGALDARDLSYHAGDQQAKEAVLRIRELPDDERQAELKFYFSGQFNPMNPSDEKRFRTSKETK